MIPPARLLTWLLLEVSLPYFSQNLVRNALALLGVALGVGSVVATTSVSESLFHSFRQALQATAGSAELQLSNGTAGVPEDLVSKIAGIPGVAVAAPLVEGFVPLASTPGDMLVVFGLDLLGSTVDGRLSPSAVHVPDELVFVAQPDSVALASTFATQRGYTLGSPISVLSPTGQRTLVVRGFVDADGPAALFGGMVGLMDLPAAQRLLGKEGKLDRIDVHLAPGGPTRREVEQAIAAHSAGMAKLESTSASGARVEELLFSVRIALSLASLVGAIVGFFIIHHTVTVSLRQRTKDIALLNSLGISRSAILAWLLTEAVLIGTLAAALGVAIGFGLAQLSLSTVGGVATAWIRIQPEGVVISPSVFVLAVGVGVTITLAATLIPVWAILSKPTARLLHLVPQVPPSRRIIRNTFLTAVAGLTLTFTLLVVAPRTLPYHLLIAYIFGVNCLALLSFAFLSPLAARLLGRSMVAVAARRRGLQLLLASSALARHPSGPVAVLAAIVMGLGWTLADAALVGSLKQSWLGWLDQHYRSDLVVSAGGATVSLLTYPPIDQEIVRQLREMSGVREVQGVRSIEIEHGGRPVVLQAIDRASEGLPLVGTTWSDIAPAFWAGKGVVITENLSYKTGTKEGDEVSLSTPTGTLRLPVLGIFADFQTGGDLGSIACSRELYQERWRDSFVSRIRVWKETTASAENLRAEIHRRFGPTRGLHVMTFAEARASVVDLVDNVFSITYALVIVALTVSFVGVTNFLLSAVLDRRAELRTLHAVGVSTRQIGGTIVTEGALLGTLGVALGIAAGAVVSRIIVLHSVPMVNGWHFEYRFPFTTAVATGAGAILLASAAGLLLPARQAMRRSRSTDGVPE